LRMGRRRYRLFKELPNLVSVDGSLVNLVNLYYSRL
jgi:hypothetical protein